MRFAQRHTSRFLVGIVSMLFVTFGYLFASGSATSFEDAIGQLFLAVVCTAGVGLVLWLVFAYFVGWIILEVFAGIRSGAGAGGQSAGTRTGRTPGDAARDPAATSRSRANRAAATLRPSRQRSIVAVGLFLERSRAAGQDLDQAVARLRAAGWTDDDIATAREAVGW